jgi:transposase
VDGAYSVDQFIVDWEQQEVWCPQGKQSVSWTEYVDRAHKPWIIVQFSRKDCRACPTRAACTRAQQHKARSLQLPPQEQYEALQARRAWAASAEGKRQYARRAGIEGTLSQGVRAFGLRRTRYRGLEKTHLQHVATAAINIDRLVAWLDARPRAQTRTSRFAALAPTCTMPSGTLPGEASC